MHLVDQFGDLPGIDGFCRALGGFEHGVCDAAPEFRGECLRDGLLRADDGLDLLVEVAGLVVGVGAGGYFWEDGQIPSFLGVVRRRASLVDSSRMESAVATSVDLMAKMRLGLVGSVADQSRPFIPCLPPSALNVL